MTRVWNVVRMHLVNRWTYVAMPWIIVGATFAMTLAIWMLVRSAGATAIGDASGALWSLYIYLMIVAVLAVTYAFPFALGFSVTRRDFYLGTALLFVLIAAANSVALTTLTVIEKVSGGWWLDGTFFRFLPEGDDSLITYWLVFFSLQAFCCFAGAASATVFMRWRVNGMVVFWLLLGVLLVGGFAIVAYTDSWAAINSWMQASGALGLAAQSLVLTTLAGLVGFAILRSTPDKN